MLRHESREVHHIPRFKSFSYAVADVAQTGNRKEFSRHNFVEAKKGQEGLVDARKV